jgi:hypothetical protein
LSIASENEEITAVVNRLLDNLLTTASSQVGSSGSALRRQVGDLRTNYGAYLSSATFNANLLACFTTARLANAKLSNFVKVREALFLENPVGGISQLIVQSAIAFCLGAESRLITGIVFTSRDDVEAMLATMKLAFDTARDLAADLLDSLAYQNLISLAGALTNHLATQARPLPRMVTFNLNATMPALTLSNRIYYDASRWDEIVDENHIVNPAFCPREIRGLAS